MNSTEVLATDLMDVVCGLSQTQDPHPGWGVQKANLLI